MSTAEPFERTSPTGNEPCGRALGAGRRAATVRRTVSPALPSATPAAATDGQADRAAFDEDDARVFTLVRAVESGPEDAALWSAEDAAWATRLADESAPANANAAQWLVARARHAQQRILPRRPALARAFARRRWGARWVAASAGLAFVAGALADLVGAGQVINLLAAPVWAIVGWNLLVYAWIALAVWRGRASSRAAGAGPLRRTVLRWLGAAAAFDEDHARSPEQRFALGWARAAAPLATSRAALLLHVAAAALALGLLAGLYARALVLDYRVGWQSTLLDAPQVHALLSVLLWPASAWSGIAVPDAQAVAALRTDAGGWPQAASVASTVPWLHLFAATLTLAVLVPRALLALLAAWQAQRRSRRLVLPVADAHAMKLLLGRRSGAPGPRAVLALPHGFTPTPAATLALRAVLVAQFGEAVELHVGAATSYGDEDHAPATPQAAVAWRIAWFDLAATPEAQAQGRFVAALLAASPTMLFVLVDETGYRQRLGAGSPRLAERRQAWQAFADEAGVGVACLDLAAAAADPAVAAQAAAALRAASRARSSVPVPAAPATS